MAEISIRARAFWLLVVLAGGAVVCAGLAGSAALLLEGSSELRIGALAMLLAGTVAQAWRIPLPNPRRPLRPRGAADGSERETTSVSSAVFAFALLALPPALAIGVAALATALVGARTPGRRWYQRVFNVAQYGLAVGIGSVLWHHGPSRVGVWWIELLWVVPTLAAYFLVNSGAVASMVALLEELPVAFVWLRARRQLLPSYALLLGAGALGWYLWRAESLFPAGVVVLFGVAAAYRSARHTVLMQQQTIDALSDLADLMDQRDAYTHQHSLRVGHYAERLAAALGLPQREAWLIFLCGRLHDIGKCAVSNEILRKPGPLSQDERLEMSRHAEIGGRMLAHFDQFREGAAFVRGHHEWYDGSGYPDGLARSRIPLGARIIAVVDAYDAMTTDRPYRLGLPKGEAVRRLRAGAGTQWDPRVVHAFLELIGDQRPPRAPASPLARPQPVLAGAGVPAPAG